MVIYADVLIFLNLIINYFLLLAVSKVMRNNPKTLRLVLGALFGAVSSLYIFLPSLNFLLEALIKIVVCLAMCLIAFGFVSIKNYLKAVILLFSITVAYGGVMYAVWLLFSPKGMVINNSVVYFEISLVVLLLFTVVGYILFSLLFKIFSRVAPMAQRCEITVFLDSIAVKLNGIVDTGNSIEDLFSSGEVIICDKKSVSHLLGEHDVKSNTVLKTRYRLLPCSTVAGVDLLEGVRCDKAEIKYGGKTVILNRPILAFSKTKVGENEAIINPKILGGTL